ncbi:SagB family peptide dehydrogenase [Tumebacillus flagellatus]|uniref:Nitroreductase domain-containing protein n=1 Tax=Tumebacillus flagellatus TaxID=1157490 RepID=A0A074LRM7_9BACL|nr:SagB family peptide dehydrogenase [Tumebacillus flagellatus]KEO83764.1 hypothetical protein EL26_07545 [Tumebacillus flagellatus]
MKPEQFLHALHYDVERMIRPPGWRVDWDDSPLLYKLYRGVPSYPLSADVPLTLPPCTPSSEKTAQAPRLREWSHFLWVVNGLMAGSDAGYGMKFRKGFPSGGGLYPNEVYVYLKTQEVPQGLYHYDAAHHRVVLVREGAFDEALKRALGKRVEVGECFGAVMVSTVFWKNFFKYNNFAYRLQGLDTGVLLGQTLEAAKRFGFTAGVCYRFLDRAVNHLLGICEWKESVYAVVPLSVKPAEEWFGKPASASSKPTCAGDIICEYPVVCHQTLERSRWVKPYPLLQIMNEYAMLENTQEFKNAPAKEKTTFSADAAPAQTGQEVRRPRVGHLMNERSAASEQTCSGQEVILPRATPLAYDLAAVMRNRTSPGETFVLGGVTKEQLAALLQEASASLNYVHDLDFQAVRSNDFQARDAVSREGLISLEDWTIKPRLSLCISLSNVEGIPDGAYTYNAATHSLHLTRSGDPRSFLQQGLSAENVNLTQAPFCLHIGGESGHLTDTYGFRGYRIQQMEAGLLLHRLAVAATALRFNAHPLLDFDTSACDALYDLATCPSRCTLLQIPVGPHRPHPRFQGFLHE